MGYSPSASAHSEGTIGYDSESNYYEYEQGNAVPIVKGRLNAALEFWTSIQANPEFLNIIASGYRRFSN